MSFCPGDVLAGMSLYKRTGNIYKQFEGFLVNIHLEKVDMQVLHSLSLLGQLSNPKSASCFL